MRRVWPLLLLGLMACDDCNDGVGEQASDPSRAAAEPPNPAAPRWLYTIDVRRPDTGAASIELRFRDPPAGAYAFVQGRPANEVSYDAVVAQVDGKDAPVSMEGPAKEPRRQVRVPPSAKELRLRWRATPSGPTRHGRVGYVGEQFALVPGGWLLLPERALRAEREGFEGVADAGTVRVQVLGWKGADVTSTLTGEAGELEPDVRGRWSFTHLLHANFAVGQLHTAEQRAGSVHHRVVTPSSWPRAKRRETARHAFALFRVFQQQAPCDSLGRYTTIFLPAGPSGTKVTGEYWSTGQAFSFDAYEDERRPWELAAHRIAHAVNRYEVCGFHIDDPVERWFVEGWASFVEVTHLRMAGIIDHDQRFIELGNRYRNIFFGLNPRVSDRPVMDEATADREPVVLYLHYTKGPLVVQQLDWAMRRWSGGDKTVNDFIASMYPTYREHQRPVPLREALSEYLRSTETSASPTPDPRPTARTFIADFFDRFVEAEGTLYPMHEGFLAFVRGRAWSPAEKALRLSVGEEQWTRGAYHALERFLAVSKLAPNEATRDVAIRMALLHEEYERRGESFVPAPMVELRNRLPASVRYQMYVHQRRELFESPEAFESWVEHRLRSVRVVDS